MAPLITHLVIAERIWPLLAGRWNGAYGSFLFGNLAADVDKFCPDLDQATTHLVSKDGTDAWLTQRSRRFIDRQADEFDIAAVVAASLDRCRKRLMELMELA
jgi:hypothetical protein